MNKETGSYGYPPGKWPGTGGTALISFLPPASPKPLAFLLMKAVGLELLAASLAGFFITTTATNTRFSPLKLKQILAAAFNLH